MNDMLAAVIDQGTGKRLRTSYQLKQTLAGKTGTTQNQVDGWFIGYHPQLVFGVRVGANNENIHFQSTRLGQGANMALPIFGEFMQACLKDHKFSHWQTLHFPIPQETIHEEEELPLFKNKLNWMEKLQNNKFKKVEQKEKATTPKDKSKKENFFKRLFKRKGKNRDN
jgi:penicillin-binding protein 1A